jgi:hypothetical protein
MVVLRMLPKEVGSSVGTVEACPRHLKRDIWQQSTEINNQTEHLSREVSSWNNPYKGLVNTINSYFTSS